MLLCESLDYNGIQLQLAIIASLFTESISNMKWHHCLSQDTINCSSILHYQHTTIWHFIVSFWKSSRSLMSNVIRASLGNIINNQQLHHHDNQLSHQNPISNWISLNSIYFLEYWYLSWVLIHHDSQDIVQDTLAQYKWLSSFDIVFCFMNQCSVTLGHDSPPSYSAPPSL